MNGGVVDPLILSGPALALISAAVLWVVPKTLASYQRSYFAEVEVQPHSIRQQVVIIAGLFVFWLLLSFQRPFPAPLFTALCIVAGYGVWRLDRAFCVIPDRFQVLGLVGAVGLSFFGSDMSFLPADAVTEVLLGLTAPLLLFVLTLGFERLMRRDGLGRGDLKLLVWLAVALGSGVWIVIGLASLLAAAGRWGSLARPQWREAFAFGPYLLAAAAVVSAYTVMVV